MPEQRHFSSAVTAWEALAFCFTIGRYDLGLAAEIGSMAHQRDGIADRCVIVSTEWNGFSQVAGGQRRRNP